MLPEGWKLKLADEICLKITKGTTPPSEEILQIGDIPFLRVNNLTVGGSRSLQGAMIFVTPKAHQTELARSKSLPDDTLINIVGPPLSKVTLLNRAYSEYNLNQAIVLLRPSRTTVEPEFLFYFMTDPRTWIWLETRSKKTSGQQNLTIETCKQIPVLLPPLSEQRRIAEILSTWDRAIAVQERLVANARAQKKALMQTLLTGKKRLPGFKGEWKMKLFKHVVSIDQDSLGQNTPPDFEFRYISLSDVSSGSIANNLPSHTFSEAPSRARRKLKLGDILMATVRPNLQAFARVQSAQSDCIASTGFSVLSAKRDHSADHVYHYLFSEHITGQIDALVVGSSYPAINSADVANLAIHCPEKAEQDAIAQVLNDSDETVISGETKLSILKREKSALMQQLLTGKRRVKIGDPDTNFENHIRETTKMVRADVERI